MVAHINGRQNDNNSGGGELVGASSEQQRTGDVTLGLVINGVVIGIVLKQLDGCGSGNDDGGGGGDEKAN